MFTVDLYYFFFNDAATTEIYTLSLHDALPIWAEDHRDLALGDPHVEAAQDLVAPEGLVDLDELHRVLDAGRALRAGVPAVLVVDRKSTRLNSSHANISYAVFCLKKKKKYLTIL